MNTIVQIIFFISVFLIVYNYVLYPIIVIWLSRRKISPESSLDAEFSSYPDVSFIIAAYNEEKVIARKIENTLQLLYPDDKIEVIVVSDGSNDSTPDIVSGFGDKGVISLHDSVRSGKTAALNRAVEIAKGEVIVFSDANNDFSTDAIINLVKHFEDPSIGAVNGAKHIYHNTLKEAAVGDGLYWKYESAIKHAESLLGSITAADGEIVAIRKSLYRPIDPKLINDDAAITFNIVKAGYRIIYEPEARSYEQASEDLLDDINVKIRMTIGGFQTIFHEKNYLFPPRSWFAFNFISHKVLRWLTPHFMILAFISNLFLVGNLFYFIILLLQSGFYMVSVYGWSIRKSSVIPSVIYVPMYFTVMNIALFIGFFRFIRKDCDVNWKKAKR